MPRTPRATVWAVLVLLSPLFLAPPVVGQSAKNRNQPAPKRLELAVNAAQGIRDKSKRDRVLVQIATQFAQRASRDRAVQIANDISDQILKRQVLADIEEISLFRSVGVSEDPLTSTLKLLKSGQVRPAMKVIETVKDPRAKDFLLLNVVSGMTTNQLLEYNLMQAERRNGEVRFATDRLMIKKPQYSAAAMTRAAGYAEKIQNEILKQFALSMVALAHLNANQTSHAREIADRITDQTLKDVVLLQLATKLATGKMVEGMDGWLRLSRSEAAELPTLKSLQE